jgi:3-methylcrotonyl-CoA carboxylase alpha subunit
MGSMSVRGEALVLRDEAGNEHRVLVANGSVTIGDAAFNVSVANDGSIRIAGPSRALAWTATSNDTVWVFLDGQVYIFEAENASTPRRRTQAHHGSLMAPMPATVRKVAVKAGDAVRHGDVLIVLEAMKMELPVRATSDGTVSAIHCREGELVQPGVSLIEID